MQKISLSTITGCAAALTCYMYMLFFAFFSARPGRISWAIGTIYTPKREGCAFQGSPQYPTTLRGQTHKKTYQNGRK